MYSEDFKEELERVSRINDDLLRYFLASHYVALGKIGALEYDVFCGKLTKEEAYDKIRSALDDGAQERLEYALSKK